MGGMAGPIDPLFIVVALPGLAGALLAQPWRRADRSEWKNVILVLALIGLVPIASYGMDQALMQRNTFPPSADPHHNAHWWAMSALAFAGLLVLGGAGVCIGGVSGRPRLDSPRWFSALRPLSPLKQAQLFRCHGASPLCFGVWRFFWRRFVPPPPPCRGNPSSLRIARILRATSLCATDVTHEALRITKPR